MAPTKVMGRAPVKPWRKSRPDDWRTQPTQSLHGRVPPVRQNNGGDVKRPLRAGRLIAAGLLVLLTQDLAAQTNRIGIGTTSCAQFAELYRDTPEETETVFYSWAMGVMSGLNVSLREERANLMPHNFGADAQKGYIRRFCDERPADLYVDAVMELYATLRRKQSLPPWQLSRHRNK
jgi:hypothetical protein